MRPEVTLAIGFFVVGLIIMILVMFFLSWLRGRRIRSKAPEFDGSLESLNKINYDREILERRKMKQENGNTERRANRNAEEGVGGFEEGGRSESNEEKISRISKRIKELRS